MPAVDRSTSPIKDKPLRLPAQSLTEERDAIWDDKLEPLTLVALLLLALAALEWFRYLTNARFTPILFSVAAVGVSGMAGWRIWKALPRLRRLRQAIEGEKAVGQYLERLREDGYVVYHDVVGPGFNVDHVLIGPTGVFTVETKTWSKPAGGPAPKISYDGHVVRAGGFVPDRDPAVQARAQASWLRTVLKESTGRNVRVFPVVVFPGWFVEQDAISRSTVWLLEPKALPAFLAREPVVLAPEDKTLLAFHLSRFIRSGERRR